MREDAGGARSAELSDLPKKGAASERSERARGAEERRRSERGRGGAERQRDAPAEEERGSDTHDRGRRRGGRRIAASGGRGGRSDDGGGRSARRSAKRGGLHYSFPTRLTPQLIEYQGVTINRIRVLA
uniref:Uncharacterized protein n=1 Tax=uncultured prokaryote TaxID=198431 RepID=A0A0H5Q064_9ZZZZ|nr:hypothetical protein [uncultured prokaryote]